MPFQAIAYALRVRTGDPLSKLVFIKLVGDAHADGYVEVPHARLAAFCGASQTAIRGAVAHLVNLGLAEWFPGFEPTGVDEAGDDLVFVALPLSREPLELRKRPKLTIDQLQRIAAHTNDRCAACGDGEYELTDFHVDHIIPRSRRGADIEDNLQILCPKCNLKKHAREHWIDYLGGATPDE